MSYTTEIIRRTAWGSAHIVIAELTFSGSYPDEGEPINEKDLGLLPADGSAVHYPSYINVMFDGPVIAADGETALVPCIIWTTPGPRIGMLESSGTSGTALVEKNADAYPTGAKVRAVFVWDKEYSI